MSSKDLQAFLDDEKHEHYTHEDDLELHEDNLANVGSEFRAEIAMAALTGIIQKASSFDPIRHSLLAVDYADALIKALEYPEEI